MREIQKIFRGRETIDGGGVKLRRLLTPQAYREADPFLLVDEFHNDDPSTYIAGFPPHPHRGFETITYLLAGRIHHRDSRGHEGHLGPLSLQWMTAGSGIVHSEMPEQEDGLLWGYQIWLNLSTAQKMTKPRYQDIPAEDIPEVEEGPLRIRVLAGEYKEKKSPVMTFFPVLYLDLSFSEESFFYLSLPVGDTVLVICIEGNVEIGERRQQLVMGELALLGEGEGIGLYSKKGRLLLLSAPPLREPMVAHGPFVMNSREEIEQAYRDYAAGLFEV
ncbi:MAG: pirin family protein [Leptospiraceae bacterium]|nr:pirin family protein [Leptospiraceae bacterium]MDW8306685.1 pirin family protein [Leptospiraceae bacterium]